MWAAPMQLWTPWWPGTREPLERSPENIRAVNKCFAKFHSARRRPLLGPSPGWKRLLVLSQEKALVGAFSVIVKADCETDGALHSTVPGPWRQARRHPGQLLTLRWSHTSTNYWGYHCSVTTTSHPQPDNYDIIIHSSVMSSICSPTTTTYLESRQSMLAITIS